MSDCAHSALPQRSAWVGAREQLQTSHWTRQEETQLLGTVATLKDLDRSGQSLYYYHLLCCFWMFLETTWNNHLRDILYILVRCFCDEQPGFFACHAWGPKPRPPNICEEASYDGIADGLQPQWSQCQRLRQQHGLELNRCHNLQPWSWSRDPSIEDYPKLQKILLQSWSWSFSISMLHASFYVKQQSGKKFWFPKCKQPTCWKENSGV